MFLTQAISEKRNIEQKVRFALPVNLEPHYVIASCLLDNVRPWNNNTYDHSDIYCHRWDSHHRSFPHRSSSQKLTASHARSIVSPCWALVVRKHTAMWLYHHNSYVVHRKHNAESSERARECLRRFSMNLEVLSQGTQLLSFRGSLIAGGQIHSASADTAWYAPLSKV